MSILALIHLGLALGSSASIIPRAENEPRFLSYPIVHRKRDARLAGRDTEVTLHNQSVTTYLFELDIGTPPQRVEVVLDTGSFELWVDPKCSGASTADQTASCKKAGAYDPNSSSTVVDMEAENQLPYGKGIVNVAYVADSIKLPGSGSTQTLKEVIFGVGLDSEDLAYGIAGVGHGKDYNLVYSNLIDELYLQGVTNSRAFSVALGSKDASDGGSVIFGGVDTKKFTGNLVAFQNLPPQIEQGQTGLYRYWIQLNSVGITKPGSKSTTYANSALPIVLDTGATMSYLPQSVINQFVTDFKADVLDDGSMQVPCETASQAGTVDFTFGSLTIRVPFHEFIWEVVPGGCVIAAAPAGQTTAILGDSFLRSAYVVFDQSNDEILLAQYKNCGTNEHELPAGVGAAANFTGECKGGSSVKGGATAARSSVWAVAAVALGLQALFVLVL